MKFLKRFACVFTIVALCSSSVTVVLRSDNQASVKSKIARVLPLIHHFSKYFAQKTGYDKKYPDKFVQWHKTLEDAITKVQEGESGLVSALISLEKVAVSMIKVILKEHKGAVSSSVIAGALLAFFVDKYGNKGKGLDRLKGKFSKTKGVLLENCYLCKLKTCVVCKVQELYGKWASFFGTEKDEAAKA